MERLDLLDPVGNDLLDIGRVILIHKSCEKKRSTIVTQLTIHITRRLVQRLLSLSKPSSFYTTISLKTVARVPTEMTSMVAIFLTNE